MKITSRTGNKLLTLFQVVCIGSTSIALSACNSGSPNNTLPQNAPISNGSKNSPTATSQNTKEIQYQYDYSLSQVILKAFPSAYNSDHCIYKDSNGGCNNSGVIAEKVLSPEEGTYTADLSDISQTDYQNATVDDGNSFTQTTHCNNDTDITQPCTTSSYSKTVTNSTTSTLTSGWKFGFEYSHSRTRTFNLQGTGAIDPSGRSVTNAWKISGEYNGSISNSTTTSETITYSANAQTISIPPHKHYDVVTTFTMINVNDDFPATLSVTGVAPLDTYENQRSGGANSGLFYPQQGSVDAYTELSRSTVGLPTGITLNQANKTITLDGTVNVNGTTGTDYTIQEYDVTNKTNQQEKVLLKSYQIKTDKVLISRKVSSTAPTKLINSSNNQSLSTSSTDNRYRFWYNIGTIGSLSLDDHFNDRTANDAKAMFTDSDEDSKGHGIYGYKLIMQDDGNLVLYAITTQLSNGKADFIHGGEKAIWASDTENYTNDPEMYFDQGSCKLTVTSWDYPYARTKTIVNENGNKDGPCTIILQSDGNFVMYGKDHALWATNTAHKF